MKKLIKITLSVLFTLILLLLAAPMFISADTLKKQVSEQASKATGRAIDIKGKATLTLFPDIAVSVEDVTVGNPEGFASPYLIHAKTLAAGASLGPLMRGNLNITGITLHGADIRLEQLASGAKNWDFAKPAAAAEDKQAEKKSGGSAALKSFALGDISIKDSNVAYTTPQKKVKADHINLVVRGADAHGAFKAEGNLNYQGKPVKLNAEVTKLSDFLRGRASPARLALDIPGGTVKFDGKAENAEAIAATGKVVVDLNDIPGTIKWASVPAPKLLPKAVKLKGDATLKGQSYALKGADVKVDVPGGAIAFTGDAAYAGDVAADGKLMLALNDVAAVNQWATGKVGKNLPKTLNLNAEVSAKAKKYELKNATVKSDNVEATGDVTANLQSAIPVIAGTLKFGMLDLNTLMKTADATPTHGWMDAYAAEPSAGWSDVPLGLDGLRAVDANLTITADALRQGNLEVSDIAIHPQLSGGNLTLTIDKASLYGGTATGVITASGNGAQGVGANLTFAHIQMEPFLTALKGKTNLRGTADMKLNVKGAGSTQRMIISNLNGNGDMRVTDGAIKGINIGQFLRDAKKGFLYDNPGRSTDFSELSATFTIVQGIVSNQDLAMKAPTLRVSGKGTIDLPRRMVNYRLTPSVVTSVKGQGGESASGLDIPLDITGSIDNPSITPDITGMVQKQLQDPTAIKNTIKDVKGTIKNLNSPEDIGKALFGGGGDKSAPVPTPQPATPAPASTTTPAPAAPQVQSAPAPKPTPEDQLIQGVGGLLQGLQKH